LNDEAKQRAQGKKEIEVNEETFHIHRETVQLELIKDVRDELNMILMVLSDQQKAVDEADRADSGENLFDSNLNHILELHNEITQLDQRAEKVYIAVGFMCLVSHFIFGMVFYKK